MIAEGQLLWTPPPAVREAANLTRYIRWLHTTRRLALRDYAELWRWSVDQPGEFWQSIWDFFDVRASATSVTALRSATMPGAEWFPGAQLNFAENVFRRMATDQPAVYYRGERTPLASLTRDQIRDQVASLAATLRHLGVVPGDRVAAYMPNTPETLVAFLATASVGAIWSSCSPDFGSRSVLDRFNQIGPKILFAVDAYVYGGQRYDRRQVLSDIRGSLSHLERTILLSKDSVPADTSGDIISWERALERVDDELSFAQVPFDHPLWILYTSGTTGLPKAVVQGHGGILLEHLKSTTLHTDLRAGDRFFWHTSTGWMMWNYLVGGLLTGSAIVLYDGSPAAPDLTALWRFVEESGITYFGTSAAFIDACSKADVKPNQQFDLSQLRGLGSTGSPLGVGGFEWVYEHVNSTIALESVSGGTDICTAVVGGIRTQPVYAGEIQGRSLGANVHAFNAQGVPVIGEVGELVIITPMPSMPLYFWNDPGMARYKASYFETYPGVWRHGDWIRFNERGGAVIYGRSDSTINRHGVRMGTSEIYQAVESLPEIQDSLVVDLELLGRESFMPLFVVIRNGHQLTPDLRRRIAEVLRRNVSPRHVPDEIIEIPEVPYTLSGKKMELPIRKILLGMRADAAVNPGAMRNPAALDFFRRYAGQLAHQQDRRGN
jgi:acetoacetyl-CoA synthetase